MSGVLLRFDPCRGSSLEVGDLVVELIPVWCVDDPQGTLGGICTAPGTPHLTLVNAVTGVVRNWVIAGYICSFSHCFGISDT